MTSLTGRERWWLIPPLYLCLVVPTVAVAIISLAILSGMIADTRGGRWVVILLVLVQMAGGSGGLFAQAATVKVETRENSGG